MVKVRAWHVPTLLSPGDIACFQITSHPNQNADKLTLASRLKSSDKAKLPVGILFLPATSPPLRNDKAFHHNSPAVDTTAVAASTNAIAVLIHHS